MNARLFAASEAGLATLRVTAFRHVHDLSVQTQNSERRGGLVSRVTSDVDALSLFLQWAGVFLIVATGQLVLASIVMVVYSWQLALVVWVAFLPLGFVIRALQKRLAAAYLRVRERVGVMLGAVAESVVGAEVVRAYGIEALEANYAIVAVHAPFCYGVGMTVMEIVRNRGGIFQRGCGHPEYDRRNYRPRSKQIPVSAAAPLPARVRAPPRAPGRPCAIPTRRHAATPSPVHPKTPRRARHVKGRSPRRPRSVSPRRSR